MSGSVFSRPVPRLLLLSLALFSLWACAVSDEDSGALPDPDAASQATRRPDVGGPKPAVCCIICTVGKPCGGRCISESLHCPVGPGCACQATPEIPGCCQFCETGQACGDACIEATDTCHVGRGCACQVGALE